MKKLAACIIETRLVDNLVEIIKEKHLKFLPEYTQLIIFHSDKNYSQLKEAFPNSGFSNISINSLRDYNEALTNPLFWKQLEEYYRVLIFQTDSQLLRTGIEEFIVEDYDYVGAPWRFQEHGANGGISLRNPRVMREICEIFPWRGDNEDVYFSNTIHTYGGGILAPREVCLKFGAETVFSLGTLSCHAIEKWLPYNQCQQILNQYK